MTSHVLPYCFHLFPFIIFLKFLLWKSLNASNHQLLLLFLILFLDYLNLSSLPCISMHRCLLWLFIFEYFSWFWFLTIWAVCITLDFKWLMNETLCWGRKNNRRCYNILTVFLSSTYMSIGKLLFLVLKRQIQTLHFHTTEKNVK